MFTDMEHKNSNPEEHTTNLKQKSKVYSQRKKTKPKEPPPSSPLQQTQGKSIPNSKISTNYKQNLARKEPSNSRPNSTLGSPNYLLTESRHNAKHQHQKHSTVKKTNRIETQPFSLLHSQLKAPFSVAQTSIKTTRTDRQIELKTSRVLKTKPGTPNSMISNESKSTKTDNRSIANIPRHMYLDESKAHRLTPTVENPDNYLSQILRPQSSNLSDGIIPNSPCMTELVRKENHYRMQQLVEKAIKNHKIFLIRGNIPYLEESMKTRGWVQKYESTKTRMIPYGSVASLDAPSLGSLHSTDGSLNEKVIIFQMLRHVPPDFIWDCRNEFTEWNSNIKQTTLLNRFQKSFVYTSKLGMAAILDDAHWYYEEKISTVQCPRSYNVSRDRNAFLEDYRMTAATSLLKWFIEQIEKGVEHAVHGSSPIPLGQIEFAIKRCEDFVAVANNDHLDTPQTPISSQEWDLFVQDYIKAVHRENGFVETTNGPPFPEIEMLYVTASAVLKKVKDVDPQFELNGYRNIWILKPSDLCCGTGIVMTHNPNHIIKRVQDSTRDYFVVQKYIEKPLLVQDTKFDVRQWYLVTKGYPLTIWIYKESFLRFSSRPFSFTNYHEAIHICNTAVQCKYADQRNSVRTKNWDCEKINDYLKKTGYSGEPWYDRVYPKICEAIIATMLAAQQHMDKRRCSFELYGADFVIMNDLSVWLIEINTNPRMHPPSTRVTERLYPEVMESLVKVILDYPVNPNTDTGNFVLAYQQNVTTFQPYLGASMFVLGKAIDQKSKNLMQDRENSMNHNWTPLLREKLNGAELLMLKTQNDENSNTFAADDVVQ